MTPVDATQLDRVLSSIRKEYGNDIARTADAYQDPPRISTGSLELDLITRGGIPIGRWTHFYGGQFSAKTMIAFKTIASAQKMGLKCAYYNVEKQLSPTWAKQHGIILEDLEVFETTIIEEIAAIMEATMGSVHLHVIDSIPQAVSQDELAGESGDWLPGITARAWGKATRRAHAALTEENAVLMINHVGTAFGKYTGGEEPKGGKSLEYLSSLSIEFRRTSWLFRDKKGSLTLEGEGEVALDKRDKEPGGIEFATRVKKSRVSTPFKTARMRLDFKDGSIDDLWSLAKAAERLELAIKDSPKSSWFTMPDGSKVQGSNGIRGYISDNPDFYQQIVDQIASD